MFTGIVEELGELLSQRSSRSWTSLVIRGVRVMDDLATGDSIAVNGVCLTVARRSQVSFHADVMPETVRSTNLHTLKPGDRVNLERALPVGGRLGGHFLSGHVDAVGQILSAKREGNAQILKISAPAFVLRYVIKKGSIAVDGISLTVVDLGESPANHAAVLAREVPGGGPGDGWFSVSLIPHTLAETTLLYRRPGETVNLEADLLAKYVEKLFPSEENRRPSRISYEFLQEKGF